MTNPVTITVENQPKREKAMVGGAYEGAGRFSRELALWTPGSRSADQEINNDKPVIDARAKDLVRNDGFIAGAADIHKDSIVGARFNLNATPNIRVLSKINPAFDEAWAEEFQEVVEARFGLYAESPDNWPDAQRYNTLTGLVRLAVGCYFASGEVLASVEWLRATGRPFSTAVQMLDPDRLSNPMGQSDTATLRRGVERDRYGAPIAYHIRQAHPGEAFSTAEGNGFVWKRVPVRKPWGRLQFIHILEQARPDQTRGVAAMVAVLKEAKMTRKFQDVVLQNAVVNATFAAAIESELPDDVVYAQLGMQQSDSKDPMVDYLTMLSEYTGNGRNMAIDGVKVPHLFPGTKLNLKTAGQPGGVGTDFETSLLRHISAALGLSYEQFSRDYTKTNYSSARASMGETWKYMMSRKRVVADRFANIFYALWLEEAINRADGTIPLPKGVGPSFFYEGQNKDALCSAEWIGASRGQIDEMKETEAAVLRIESGLSTRAAEISRLGGDWRDVLAQQAREKSEMEKLGLAFGKDADRAAAKEQAELAAKQAEDQRQADAEQDSQDKQATQDEQDANRAVLVEMANHIGDAVKTLAAANHQPNVTVTPEIKIEMPAMNVTVDAKQKISPAGVDMESDRDGNVTGATAVVNGKPVRVAFVYDKDGAVTGTSIQEEL